MKIRIQNSNKFIDVAVEHPYLLGSPDVYERELKPQLQDIINRDNLKCSGCGKPLINRDWICINHRPMSARVIKETLRVEDKNTGEVYGEGEIELKDMWAMFLFCFDTRADCINKWKDKRPK
jgi:hypothetical protein